MLRRFYNQLHQPVDVLPLVIFRVVFGGLMLFSLIRFVAMGWVSAFYVQPSFHFTYLGFGWVRSLPAVGMYVVFAVLMLLSILVMLGALYRLSIASFFVLFTYVELIDKTYYLNHYYFISVLSLLMITLPLNQAFSVDAHRQPSLQSSTVPAWSLYSIRLLLGLVYFYAGLAKLNADWLFGALPLRIWLPSNASLPVVGQWFDHLWVAYVMSWAGALYDLTIAFWLSWRQTRPYAYLAVIAFHAMTAILFNIGVFPWVMIGCTLIFFSGDDWRRLAQRLNLQLSVPVVKSPQTRRISPLLLLGLCMFFAWQILMPLRHWLYPGNHLWTEQGYRFAWHVMLVEKTGSATFRVEDPHNDRFWIVHPRDYLTAQQEKQMSFQPDMLLQFAHHLAETYADRCDCTPSVYTEVYVSFNGRSSQLLLDPSTDLTKHTYDVLPATWILTLEQTMSNPRVYPISP